MHYFKRSIGDYAKKAGRLSMLQHGSYTLLIDACYDREQFPTLQEAIDWTWASSKEEVEAVEFVLSKFFTLTDGRYVEKDIEADITEYHAKATTNKRIANERETKRKENITNRARSVDEASPNYKPITKNQEPNIKPLSAQSSDEQPDQPAEDRRKPAKREPSADDLSLASRIFGLILDGNPTAKKPNLPTWAEDIRLMREVDGRQLPEIWSLFQWVRRDAFWRPNVLCPAKLREKWDQLTEKRNAPVQPGRAAPVINEKFNFDHLDRSGDAIAAAESRKRHGIVLPADDVEIEI